MQAIPEKVLVFTDEGGQVVGKNSDGNWLVDLEGVRFVITPDRNDGKMFIGRTEITADGSMSSEFYPVPEETMTEPADIIGCTREGCRQPRPEDTVIETALPPIVAPRRSIAAPVIGAVLLYLLLA